MHISRNRQIIVLMGKECSFSHRTATAFVAYASVAANRIIALAVA
jgi:hypothetical protein